VTAILKNGQGIEMLTLINPDPAARRALAGCRAGPGGDLQYRDRRRGANRRHPHGSSLA
jgi:hypothetical protein